MLLPKKKEQIFIRKATNIKNDIDPKSISFYFEGEVVSEVNVEKVTSLKIEGIKFYLYFKDESPLKVSFENYFECNEGLLRIESILNGNIVT